MKLDSHRFQGLLGALTNLNSDLGPQSLPARALAFSQSILPADCASFDFFTGDNHYAATPWTDRPDIATAENMAVFNEYVHEHALIPLAMARKDGTAMRMTDVLSQSDFERTALYNEFYRKHGLRRQMGLAMPVTRDLTVSFVVTNGSKDFSDADRELMILAAPHLLNAIRNSLSYDRVDTALGEGGTGILVLESRGRIAFASRNVETLLSEFFDPGPVNSSGLPLSIVDWIGAGRDNPLAPPAPLIVEKKGGVLRLRLIQNAAAGEMTILLEGRRQASTTVLRNGAQLTPRESEVLFWISVGKSNAAIALLCDISARTVHKHTENLYRKLGVETRTGAMMAAHNLF